MFTIDKEAEVYMADLFVQQDEKELELKVDIEKAGTPSAIVAFNFCFPKDLAKSYKKFSYNGFDCYVNEINFDYLKGSNVALKQEQTGKKLTITAPNAKGKVPQDSDPLADRIKYTLAAYINPQLASHGGSVELIKITDDNRVVLNFGGGCQGCSSVEVTLKNGVESQLIARFPEIKAIVDVTDHTQTENAYM